MNTSGKRGLVSLKQMAKSFWLIIALIALLCLGGCLNLKRKTPAFYYYTLEYAAPQIPDLNPLNADIYVERFVAVPPFDTDRMIYRRRKFGRHAYLYHRWQTRPAGTASFLLARDLRESHAFHRIYREYLPPAGAYRLKGVVEDFLGWDSPDHREAVLRLRIILSKGNGSDGKETTLFEKTYLARRSTKSEDPRGLARAMSQALKEVSARLIKDIHRVIERQNLSGQ